MNAQDLKNSILQLAIQGKLVEQREEEGTAKELIKQIEAEKKHLIKEGKIKKQKELPEIKVDEIPFDIPESWEWVRLIEIGITQTGNTPSKTKMEYFGNFIPFISPGDILNGVINYENQGLSEQGKEVGRVSERNSILQVCIGGSIGKCAINSVDVSYNQQINAITPLICNHLYVYYLVDSRFFLVSMTHKATGTATPIINKSSWESIIVPLPPLEEQKRIVAKIEELMPYVEKYNVAYSEVEKLNKKFPEDMQKSILQYAIRGKLVEQREEDGTAEDLYKQIQEEKKKLIKEGKIKKTKDLPEITEDEIPFDIPENWKWVRLGDITHNWGQKKPEQKFDYIDVGSVDNKNGRLSEKENLIHPNDAPSRARKIVKEGTVLYSTVRPYLLNICIIDKAFKHEPIASTAFSVLHPIEGINNKYLYFILKSAMFISFVSSVMIGVAYPAINDSKLLAGLIPLPPLAEQKRIVERIEELLPYTKQLVKKPD